MKKASTISLIILTFLTIAVMVLWYTQNIQKDDDGAEHPVQQNDTETLPGVDTAEIVEKQNQEIESTDILYNADGSVDTSNWKTYRNEEIGLEVKYPNGWEVVDTIRRVVTFINSETWLNYNKNEKTTIHIDFTDWRGGYGMEGYVHLESEVYVDNILAKKDTWVGGEIGKLSFIDVMDEEAREHYKKFGLVLIRSADLRNKKIYEIGFGGNKEKLEIFDTFIKTFKFI